ncbi:MAG: hypothetical protein QOI24_2314 [Acidobacteriota bacterium]|jgi:hypothetical protein|nr:hypothetical protein [Acidobacteriota bacterium]
MFEIQFQGVITHATLTNSSDEITRQLAILYDVPNVKHVPKLTVRDADNVVTTLTSIGSGVGTTCYRLEGLVEFDLPAGLPSLFLDGVPRLTQVTTGPGTPRTVLRNQIPHPDFHAYVVLPRGAVYVGDWFKYKGQFGAGPAVCVPKTIIYSVAATAPVKMTITTIVSGVTHKETATIPANATILISNNERAEDAPMPHFGTYANFFDTTVFVVPVYQSGERCDLQTGMIEIPACLGDSHLSVECSNTLYP